MSSTTYAPQQPAVAAAARRCAAPERASGRMWNVAVAMSAVDLHLGFVQDITTKRPARHLGGHST